MVAGLTGGIASGKSLVAAELERLGAIVIDADVIARHVVEPGSGALAEIEREFGPGVIRKDGSLDRKALGDVVFSDPERLKALNRIMHPRIIEQQRRLVQKARRESPGTLIVVNAAVLIEAGEHTNMDKVIVIYADEEKQVERLCARDGLTPSEALMRVRSQMPLKEKTRYADYVIYNNGSVEETLEQTRRLYAELCSAGG